jgi:hypothetical protein
VGTDKVAPKYLVEVFRVVDGLKGSGIERGELAHVVG